MVFEFFVFGVILLAVGYWATLFTMGRRDDVLHGDFVQEEEPASPAVAPLMPRSVRPPLRPAPAPAARKDSLEALLTVIKRDIQDATRS